MTPQNLNKDVALPESNPWKGYMLLATVFLVILGTITFSYFHGLRMINTYAPLVDAALEIKLETTTQPFSGKGLADLLKKYNLRGAKHGTNWCAEACLDRYGYNHRSQVGLVELLRR